MNNEKVMKLDSSIRPRSLLLLVVFVVLSAARPPVVAAQQHILLRAASPSRDSELTGGASLQSTSHKVSQVTDNGTAADVIASGGDYQIGPEDLLQIAVLDAPELSRTVRVSAEGVISLPLLGPVQAAGLSTRELQDVLANLLQRSYMKDPQVSVFVKQMRSHPVSVFGAVEKPGVYQIRSPKTLIEILSMAQGLTRDAGDKIVVIRHADEPAEQDVSRSAVAKFAADPAQQTTAAADGAIADRASPSESITVNVKDLLDARGPRSNVMVYPGDEVKVMRAGLVYVVGQVRRPGGFLLKTNENISVLQALALAEGMTPTSNGKRARIISANGTNGSRQDVPINLAKILAGKAPDPFLKANDILFVPNSSAKSALHGFAQSTAMIVASVGGAAVYRW